MENNLPELMTLDALSTGPLVPGLTTFDISALTAKPTIHENAMRAQRKGDFAAAMYWEKARLKENPANHDAMANIGVSLRNLSQPQEALDYFGQSLAALLSEAKPDKMRLAILYANFTAAYLDLDRLEEAESCGRLSFSIYPNPLAQWCLTMTRLMAGDLENGWPLFRRRREAKSYNAPEGYEKFGAIPWDGKAQCERLLLIGEQGVGELIMYASTFDEVANINGGPLHINLTRETDRLKPLFERSFPSAKILVTNDTIPAAGTQQCFMGDAIAMMRPTFAHFPKHKGYLAADPARVAALRDSVPGTGPIIGLSWQSRNSKFGTQKSLYLSELAPILDIPGARFVNIQYGIDEIAKQQLSAYPSVHQPMTPLQLFSDIDGCAALIAACDHVVTISNINAHLAGALGVPVSLLLNSGYGRPWYWFMNREDSPWYPSMQVYRLGDANCRSTQINACAATLRETLHGRLT